MSVEARSMCPLTIQCGATYVKAGQKLSHWRIPNVKSEGQPGTKGIGGKRGKRGGGVV